MLLHFTNRFQTNNQYHPFPAISANHKCYIPTIKDFTYPDIPEIPITGRLWKGLEVLGYLLLLCGGNLM